MDPIILFFGVGLFAGLAKCDIRFHASISELLTILLLLAIGIKGGMQLYGQELTMLVPQLIGVSSLGLLIPIIVFPIVSKIGRINRVDAAALAAHYGSVSVGTFAVCMAFLNHLNVSYEPYVPLFVIVLEVPAIIIGLIMARRDHSNVKLTSLLTHAFRSRAIVFLVGGLLIGSLAGEVRLAPYNTLFVDLFYGALGLFLIEMGFLVSEHLSVLKKHGFFILAFGVIMPVVSAMIAIVVGKSLGLSLGGTVVLTVLGASASYIAVPAAMRIALPEANLGLSLGSSLGITFPFNVTAGIPLYYYAVNLVY